MNVGTERTINESMIIMLQRDQEKEVEMKEKTKWVKRILMRMGLPGVEQWNENLTMDDLRRIKKQLKLLDVDIIDLNGGNALGIYLSGNLKARWEKPTFILRKNPDELDRRKQFYLEMHLQTKDVFDDNGQD